ncbi:MAG: large conductance mechanosensitive channel protein MscL [Nostocaceae cyanobacterium]|nr:large conductance mechanosensitive channel protein MscL [Nostocaceae cyanobacterium]
MARRRANGLFSDFQKFISQGNVVDLAVAVIIGGAFGKIVTSFVEDVVMPLINPLVGAAGDDWRKLTIGPGIKIGSFLGAVVDFLIITFIIFLMVRALEKFKRKEEMTAAAEPTPPDPAIESQERLTEAMERLTRTIERKPIS